MRQIVIQEKKDEDGEKYLTVDSEDDWHEALRRGRWIETPLQLAEQIGVPMNEDVGTLADINAAGAGWGWPQALPGTWRRRWRHEISGLNWRNRPATTVQPEHGRDRNWP